MKRTRTDNKNKPSYRLGCVPLLDRLWTNGIHLLLSLPGGVLIRSRISCPLNGISPPGIVLENLENVVHFQSRDGTEAASIRSIREHEQFISILDNEFIQSGLNADIGWPFPLHVEGDPLRVRINVVPRDPTDGRVNEP